MAHATGKLHTLPSLSPREPCGPGRRVLASLEVRSWLFHRLGVGLKRVCVVTDLDVVCNGADTGEVGGHCFRRRPLRPAAHRSGERDVAVLRHA